MTDEASDPLEALDVTQESLNEEERSTIRSALSAEDPIRRRKAARLASATAVADAESVLPLVEDLAPLLEAERVSTAQHAATALMTIAGDHREELVDVVPQIVTLATHEVNAPRLLGADLLATIVVEFPEAAAEDVHRLLPTLHEETGPYEPSELVEQVDNPDSVQSIVDQEQGEHRMKLESLGILANVMVAVVEAEPAAMFDHVEELADLVDHDDGTIAGAAIDAVAEVAQADPGAAAPAFQRLVDCLQRDDERVQARAVRALGFLEDDRAVEPLRTLAERTDEEDLEELATETAAFLDR